MARVTSTERQAFRQFCRSIARALVAEKRLPAVTIDVPAVRGLVEDLRRLELRRDEYRKHVTIVADTLSRLLGVDVEQDWHTTIGAAVKRLARGEL